MSTLLIILWSLQVRPEPTNPATLPPLKLSSQVYPEGVTSEADYLKWLDDLERRWASDPAAVTFRANWLVAIRCEPHATRLLLGLADREDLKALLERSERATALLTGLDPQWTTDFEKRDQAEMIAAFARALGHIARAGLGQADVEALERSANELALWLDDDDPAIAAAALLWQSLLYEYAGKPDRALQAFPAEIPERQISTASFFVQVRRLSLLAGLDRLTLAQALALQLEERCERWFPDPDREREAFCTLTWMRRSLAGSVRWNLRALPGRLLEDIRNRATQTLQEEDPACRFLRLQALLPLLFEAPAGAKLPG